jgi:predicted nucleotidyltransferase
MNRPVELFIEDLGNRPDFLGIAVFGSAARGDGRPDSDVDLFVLTNGLERRAVERISDTNLEIVYTTEEGAKSFAKGRMDAFLNMWRDAKILVDKDGGMIRLKQFADEAETVGKKGVEEWKRKHTEFDIRDGVQASISLATTDSPTAEMHLQRCIFNLLQFYFDLHKIWTPPPKKQLTWLRENDDETAKRFDNFYTATSQEEKLKSATDLVDYIFAST